MATACATLGPDERWATIHEVSQFLALAESTIAHGEGDTGEIRSEWFGRARRFWWPDVLMLSKSKLESATRNQQQMDVPLKLVRKRA